MDGRDHPRRHVVAAVTTVVDSPGTATSPVDEGVDEAVARRRRPDVDSGPSRVPGDGLPAVARRVARPVGWRRAALPRRILVDARRILRRRGVLRRLGLPDHLAPDRRARPQRSHRVRQVLEPAGAAPVPGAVRGLAVRRRLGGARRNGRAAVAAPSRHRVVDLLREQLGPDPRRCSVLRRRGAVAPTPVEPRGRRTVVPDLAVAVRCADAVASVTTCRRRCRRRCRVRRVRLHVLDAVARPDPARWAPADSRRRRSHQLPLPLHDHTVRRPPARRRRRVRLAPVAMEARGRCARRATARPARRCGGGGDRLCGRGRVDHGGLRLPMVAAARLDPLARGRDGRRPPVVGRLPADHELDPARRGRQAQLRPVPVELADLRDRRRHHRFGVGVRVGDVPDGRRRRGVVPISGVTGSQGDRRTVVERPSVDHLLADRRGAMLVGALVVFYVNVDQFSRFEGGGEAVFELDTSGDSSVDRTRRRCHRDHGSDLSLQ